MSAALHAQSLEQREPAWWSASDTKIWSQDRINADNAAPINVGQLKHVATMAALYLDARFQEFGGAGNEIMSAIGAFKGRGPVSPPEDRAENAAVANVGQLKSLGDLFYKRMAVFGYDAAADVASRLHCGLSMRTGRTYNVPWNSSAPAAENAAPATVGQLKIVFGFQIDFILDTDQDGLMDTWEMVHANSLTVLDGIADPDHDGFTNTEEQNNGTNHLHWDSDGDWASDSEEALTGTDPLDAGSTLPGLLFSDREIGGYQYLTGTAPGYSGSNHHLHWSGHNNDGLPIDGYIPAPLAPGNPGPLPYLDFATLIVAAEFPATPILATWWAEPRTSHSYLDHRDERGARLEQLRTWYRDRAPADSPLHRLALIVKRRTTYIDYIDAPRTETEEYKLAQYVIPSGGRISQFIDITPELHTEPSAPVNSREAVDTELILLDGTIITNNGQKYLPIPAFDSLGRPIPPGVFNGTIPIAGTSDQISLLSIEVVELSPKLKDESGTEIADSNKPVALPNANGMVEEDAANNRVAHREMKVRIGSALKDKKVTWSMDAKFTPTGASQPRFRGDWATAAEAHRNRFEASTTYGENGFTVDSQAQAKTTIDANGFTAIRVNVPPWGLNKARIKIQIEGTTTPIELIDLEVPGVIVIDPGHGIGAAGSSNAIGGSGDTTGALEHEFALDIGNRMAADLRSLRDAEHLPLKIFMTRTGTGNLTFPDRTRVARENGCDVYVSIHFNAVDGVPLRRHPFGMWDTTGNHNLAQDQALAVRLRQALQRAIAAVEPAESRDAATDGVSAETHEANLQKPLDTCSDSTNNTTPNYNGNIPGHTPCRAALIELEWMSNNRADLLFNEGNATLSATANRMREEAAQAMADAAIEDLYTQPAQ